MSKLVYLSHQLSASTPAYGNGDPFRLERVRDICCGDRANNSFLYFSAHIGTHIDMPFHFHKNGQTIKDYPADFWLFTEIIIVEVVPKQLVIEKELIGALEEFDLNKLANCDLLLIKTGMEDKRNIQEFWEYNTGLSPKLYDYLRYSCPKLRVIGFDSISLTSFQHRDIGKEAHENFLNPKAPILPIEDMQLNNITSETKLTQVLVSPLRVLNCDGLPCTVFGWCDD